MIGCFFFQAEDGIRDAQESRGLGDVYKRQQDTIRKAVEFRLAHRGYFHYATAEKSADEFLRKLSLIHI